MSAFVVEMVLPGGWACDAISQPFGQLFLTSSGLDFTRGPTVPEVSSQKTFIHTHRSGPSLLSQGRYTHREGLTLFIPVKITYNSSVSRPSIIQFIVVTFPDIQ